MHTMPLSRRLARKADFLTDMVATGTGTLIQKGSIADLKEMFGLVRCDTAGNLVISQGFVNEAGEEKWVVSDTQAVSAATFSTGAFTAAGAKIAAIAIVGDIFKVEYKTGSGTTKNIELILYGR